MQPDYWHERWREGRIGFHRAEANPLLIEHHAAFDESTRVLVQADWPAQRSDASDARVDRGARVVRRPIRSRADRQTGQGVPLLVGETRQGFVNVVVPGMDAAPVDASGFWAEKRAFDASVRAL